MDLSAPRALRFLLVFSPNGISAPAGACKTEVHSPRAEPLFFFFPFFPLSRHVSRQPSDPAHSLALGGHIREPVGDVPESHRGSAWATHEPGQPACPLFSWMTRGTLRMHHRARRETGSGQCGRARCEACSQRPLVSTPFVPVSTHRAIIPACRLSRLLLNSVFITRPLVWFALNKAD
jgi:hypothetical protein